MNKTLLRIGGAMNLLFVLFHLAMVQSVGAALASVSPDIRASVSVLNIQTAFTLLLFAFFSIFRSRDLLTTRVGNLMAIGISLFWFLRGVNQIVIYGPTATSIPMLVLCIVFGLLYLIPVTREWQNVPREAQHLAEKHVDRAAGSQGQVASARWVRYAAVAWCVVFGGVHLYWALGGTIGFADFSMPPNKILALTRDPIYMGVTWGVVLACAVGVIIALVPFQGWTRHIPRWMVLTPLWIAAGLFLLRGIGNPVQTALVIGGGMPFDGLSGPEAQAWYQWFKLDALYFSPWFILGGFAFGATALSAGRQRDEARPIRGSILRQAHEQGA